MVFSDGFTLSQTFTRKNTGGFYSSDGYIYGGYSHLMNLIIKTHGLILTFMKINP